MFRSEALQTISLYIRRFPTLKQLSLLKVIKTMHDKTRIKELDIPTKIKSELLNEVNYYSEIRPLEINDSDRYALNKFIV